MSQTSQAAVQRGLPLEVHENPDDFDVQMEGVPDVAETEAADPIDIDAVAPPAQMVEGCSGSQAEVLETALPDAQASWGQSWRGLYKV